MQSPSGREYEERVRDNGVILFALLIARSVVGKNAKSFPRGVRKKLLERIQVLIKEYKNPDKGISYDEPDK